MLTQAGDVYLKVHNHSDGGDLKLTVPQRHRAFALLGPHPQLEAVDPGRQAGRNRRDWVEVGSLLDTLNDGQWTLTAAARASSTYDLEFGVQGRRRQDRAVATLRGSERQRHARLRRRHALLAAASAWPTSALRPGRLPEEAAGQGHAAEADACLTATPSRPSRATPSTPRPLDEFIKLMGATALAQARGRGP